MLDYILNVNFTNTIITAIADKGVGSHVRYPVLLYLVLKNLYPCFWKLTVMLKTFFAVSFSLKNISKNLKLLNKIPKAVFSFP